MNIQNISVVGLGAMGTPIAASLLKAGYSVKGYDLSKNRMTSLTQVGLKATKSLKEVTIGADLIILSLPDWNVVREVVEGTEGILANASKGQILLDTSTVPPWETKSMAGRLARRAIDWMDTPISGSAAQAREGDILFMVGGKRSVFERVKHVLEKIGKKTVYVGKSGDAAMLKLVVNMTLFLNQAAAIEGLALGMKADLNHDVLFDVLISGAASSNLIVTRGKNIISGDFKAKGALWVAIKDLGYIMECAKRLGVSLPMAALYQQFLFSAQNNGWGQKDATVVMKIYEQLAVKGRKKSLKITSCTERSP